MMKWLSSCLSVLGTGMLLANCLFQSPMAYGQYEDDCEWIVYYENPNDPEPISLFYCGNTCKTDLLVCESVPGIEDCVWWMADQQCDEYRTRCKCTTETLDCNCVKREW